MQKYKMLRYEKPKVEIVLKCIFNNQRHRCCFFDFYLTFYFKKWKFSEIPKLTNTKCGVVIRLAYQKCTTPC